MKLNKSNGSVIAVYGILTFVYLIAFVIIPFFKNAASWISLAFTLVSMAFSLGITLYILCKDTKLKSKFYGFPILKIAYLYPIVQFVIGVIICIISAFVEVPYWIAVVLYVILLAAAAIGVIATEGVRDIITKVEADTDKATKTIKTFNISVASVLDLCNDGAVKRELESLAEDFRFSDPVSSEATEDVENAIREKLENLKNGITSLNTEENIEKIKELKNLLNERNRICKANK